MTGNTKPPPIRGWARRVERMFKALRPELADPEVNCIRQHTFRRYNAFVSAHSRSHTKSFNRECFYDCYAATPETAKRRLYVWLLRELDAKAAKLTKLAKEMSL